MKRRRPKKTLDYSPEYHQLLTELEYVKRRILLTEDYHYLSGFHEDHWDVGVALEEYRGYLENAVAEWETRGVGPSLDELIGFAARSTQVSLDD